MRWKVIISYNKRKVVSVIKKHVIKMYGRMEL